MSFLIKNEEFTPEEAFKILSEFEKDKINYVSVITKPKGGECFLIYNSSKEKEEDWRVDGIQMRNQGQKKLPSHKPIIAKQKYNLKLPDNKTSYEFVKLAYRLIIDNEIITNKVLVQYIGDETKIQPFSHGNTKYDDKPYKRTLPSSLKEFNNQLVNQHPHVVYKKSVNNNLDPRNIKQLRNLKKKINKQNRMTKTSCILKIYQIYHH